MQPLSLKYSTGKDKKMPMRMPYSGALMPSKIRGEGCERIEAGTKRSAAALYDNSWKF